jgi:uncharacterized protein (TIGR00661 family)
MAKILYGVSGQGFGHCMRSRVVMRHLVEQGHEVKVLTYGQAVDVLRADFDVVEIFGLRLAYHDNRVQYWPTILLNLTKIKDAWHSWRLVKKVITEFQPQMILTDYEPWSSLMGYFNHIPVLSVGNHHFITRTDSHDDNKKERDYLAVKFVNRLMTPYADDYFVLAITEEKIIAPNTKLLPPIVDPLVLKLTPVIGDYLLVYLTSAVPAIIEVLRSLSEQKFVVYGFNRDEVIDNVTLKNFSREGFLEDMAGCRALIANAGFSAISEALYLRKPYLAVPVAGQYEQTINAVYLEKLGLGKNASVLDETVVKEFVVKLGEYQQTLDKRLVENNDRLLKLVDEWIIEKL